MSGEISHDSETPAVGQQVITATAFIHQKFDGVEKLFLARRAKTKKFLPDVFELPGGHIDFGEDIVEGLKREILEEFDMHVGVGDPFATFTYENKIKGSHSIEVIFFARFTDSPEQIKLHPDDHGEFVWATEAECEHYLTENRVGENEELLVARKAFALLRGEAPAF